jgi:uncharacterized coiled-coil DUF342 family protein
MKEKLQDLSDRVVKLVEKAVSDLESEPELGDREVRALETVNKIITVLVEREKGRKQADPMAEMSDDELLDALQGD